MSQMVSTLEDLTEALVKAVPLVHCSVHPTEVSSTQLIINCRPSSSLKDLDAYTAGSSRKDVSAHIAIFAA